LRPRNGIQGTQAIAISLGFSGTTSNSSFDPAEDTGQPMRVTYNYTKKPFGDWDNLRIVALLPSAVGLPEAPDRT
jgi:hypothetical protein